MEDGLINLNDHFNLALLETYIEEHPEDAEKWLGFLEKRNKIKHIKPRAARDERLTIDPGSDLEVLPDDYENVCLKCKRTWLSTSQHPTMTLLCGHKYHTACWGVHSYENDDICVFEGCGQSTHQHIREISRRRDRMRRDTTDVLVDTIKNSRPFKLDIKKMKRNILNISKAYRMVKKEQLKSKKTLMKKHIFSIRQIQRDMNESVSNLRNTDSIKCCSKELRTYRRTETDIYRKYHLSLRELIKKRIIRNMNWELRGILERHNRIGGSRYRFGVRIYPGSNKWDISDSESDGEARSVGEPNDEAEDETDDEAEDEA